MSRVLSVFVGLFCLLQTYGQSYEEDIAAIMDAVDQAETTHIVSNIVVYDNEMNKNVVMQFKSELKKSGDAYRSKIAETEIISNNDLMVIVDHTEKVVQLQKQEKISKEDRAFLQELHDLEADGEKLENVSFVSNDGELNTYLLSFAYGEISSILITLNPVQKQLKKLIIKYDQNFYPENNYVEMEYSQFSLQTAFKKDLFSASDILRKKVKGFELVETYQKYTLLDLYTR